LKYILILIAMLMPVLAQAQGWPAVNSPIPAGRTAIGVVGSVATNADLALASTVDYPKGVWRLDVSAGYGATPLFFTPHTGNCASMVGRQLNTGGCVNTVGGNSWIGVYPGGKRDIMQYNPPLDGTTDASSAINAALADCFTDGGGEVYLGPYRYAVVAADIRIYQKCHLRSNYVPYNTTSADFSTVGGALVVDPARSVRICLGGKLSNVLVYQRGLVRATDKRSSITLVNAMAGVGVKATVCTTTRSDYADIRDVQILGFDTGLELGANHPVVSNVWIDSRKCFYMGPNAEAGTLGTKDFTTINNVECYGYLTNTSGTPADPRTTVATITGVADNGSGKPRLTVDTTSALVTGDTSVWPAAVGGFTGVNTRCDVAIIDATHFECSNLVTTPTSAATLNTGSKVVKLPAANVSIAYNQTVFSAGGLLPVGTRVVAITAPDYDTGAVWVLFDQAATGTSTTDTLTFTNDTYTSGGVVYLDSWYRAGAGFEFNQTDYPSCVSCFVWNHKIGFDFDNLQLAPFTNSAVDGMYLSKDPTAIGVRFRSHTAKFNKFSGSYIANGHPVVFSADNTPWQTGTPDARPWHTEVDVEYIRQPPPGVPLSEAIKGGAVRLRTNTVKELTTPLTILTLDGVTRANYSGDYDLADFAWENNSAYRKTTVVPGTRFSGGIAQRQTIMGSTTGTVAAATTNYLGPSGHTTTNAGTAFLLPQNGHLLDLTTANSTAPGGSETQTYTVRQNLTDTTLSCIASNAVSGGRTCNDLTNIVDYIANTRFDVKLVQSAGAANSAAQFRFIYQSP
jgi:hypothetical protein